MKKITLLILLLVGASIINGQFRPTLTSFSNADQILLVNAMQDYITTDVIRNHCDYHDMTGDMMLDIHDDVNFLPFHRAYLEDMEDYLIQQGLSQFVPLPTWEAPDGCVPVPFQVVDADCGSASAVCDHGVTNVTATDCSTSINWCPTTTGVSSFLMLPTVPGANNDLCDWLYPQVGSTGLSARIESPWHNAGHSSMSGCMGFFTSPSCPIFWCWHARVDDKWREWEMNCPANIMGTDLYSKDTPKVPHMDRDTGEEPNMDNGPMWVSEDIWVKNVAMTSFPWDDVHENPEHTDPITTGPTVYVRIRNRGNVASLGTEQVSLHWAKAGTALTWPANWDGTNPTLGNVIDVQTLPVIGPGESIILAFDWFDEPDPDDYIGINPEPWHFCLLSRILDADLIPADEGPSVYSNAQNNNNIVWKNISILEDFPGIVGEGGGDDKLNTAVINLGNIYEEATTVEMHFFPPANPNEPNILEAAKVYVTLDEDTWNRWLEGGKKAEGIRIYKADLRRLVVENEDAYIGNIKYDTKEWGTLSIGCSFLARGTDDADEYEYTAQLQNAETGEIMGGELYVIRRPQREGFTADAGDDQEILLGKEVTLVAKEISEPAAYNWYNENNERVGSGLTFRATPEQSTTYVLEVIANSDAARDFDVVNVTVKQRFIESAAPVPTTGLLTVTYRAAGAQKAYFNVSQPFGNSYLFDIDPSASSAQLNLAALPNGLYTIALICDEVSEDSKLISKQ